MPRATKRSASNVLVLRTSSPARGSARKSPRRPARGGKGKKGKGGESVITIRVTGDVDDDSSCSEDEPDLSHYELELARATAARERRRRLLGLNYGCDDDDDLCESLGCYDGGLRAAISRAEAAAECRDLGDCGDLVRQVFGAPVTNRQRASLAARRRLIEALTG